MVHLYLFLNVPVSLRSDCVDHYMDWASGKPTDSRDRAHYQNLLRKIKMSEEKKDEIKPESSEHINLKVTGQDGSVVHFKIKKNTPLRKLMSAYCDRAGLKLGVVRFRFDGNPINETDTPSGLDMEDGDSIDVFQQQTGGLL